MINLHLYIALVNGGVECVKSWHLEDSRKYPLTAANTVINALTKLADDGVLVEHDTLPDSMKIASIQAHAIFHDLIGFFESKGEYFNQEALDLMRTLALSDKYISIEN